jgi:hypothetical protein
MPEVAQACPGARRLHRLDGRDVLHLNEAGLLTSATLLPAGVAMASAFAGMIIGQFVRARLDAEAFRRWLLLGVVPLGLYLIGSTIVRIVWRMSRTIGHRFSEKDMRQRQP